MADYALEKLNGARRALIKAGTLDEIKRIKDTAEALRTYAKAADLGIEMQNDCAEIKIRAERKAGELLEKMEKANGARGNPGGRGAKIVGLHDVTPHELSDFGISKIQSHRWQRIATIPNQEFENHIHDVKECKRELTSVGLLKLVKIKQNGKIHYTAEDAKDCIIIDDLQKLIQDKVAFGTIYLDPPWPYDNQGTRAATNNHYETMSIDEIKKLPINNLAADKSHVHLWVTNAFLKEGLSLLEHWGFEFKSTFIWTKGEVEENKIKPSIGIGNYWRGTHEIMLLGVKGGLVFPQNGIPSFILAKRTTHSSKPEEIRSLIEQVSPSPRLELFSRRCAKNWYVWGKQINKDFFSVEYGKL